MDSSVKRENSVIMLYQTCMAFFLLWKTNKVMKNVQTTLEPTEFTNLHCFHKKSPAVKKERTQLYMRLYSLVQCMTFRWWFVMQHCILFLSASSRYLTCSLNFKCTILTACTTKQLRIVPKLRCA